MSDIRINKYISDSGLCSRRAADKLIECEKVTINDKLALLGDVVNTGDVVKVSGMEITPDNEKVYYALYKPVNVLSAAKDNSGRKLVTDLIKENKRIFPIGRLDYDSEGLILMTNDGELFNKVIHPRGETYKRYLVCINGQISNEELYKVRDGIMLDDGVTLPAKARLIETRNSISVIEIQIREGRNRQIRRMMKALGYRVIKLKRTAIGDIKLGSIKPGEYRPLNEKEINYLKSL